MEEKNRCLYDPFGKDTLSQLEIYPEFQFQIKNKDKFIAYLILVYDKNSEYFIRNADNLYQRKKIVAEKVGFELGEDNHFPDYVEEVLCGECEEFNLAMFRYVRFANIPDLPVLIKSIELLDFEMSAKLPTDPTKRDKVRSNIKNLLKDIEELEQRIFTGKESEKARESLYKLIEGMRVPRPETIAKETADKSVKLPDYYHFQDAEN
jgi:hypothetical protein